MSWRRQAGRWAAVILVGLVLLTAVGGHPALGVLAWAGSSPTPDGGSGNSSDALVALAVAVVLVGVAAWAALVIRGLSRPRRRSQGTSGRHRRDREDG